jgi:hypothetical protein
MENAQTIYGDNTSNKIQFFPLLNFFLFLIVASMGLPHIATEDIHIDGKTIPTNTIILCCLISVHFVPEVWDEPDMFRPERFLGNNGQFVKQDAFCAFSMGKIFFQLP